MCCRNGQLTPQEWRVARLLAEGIAKLGVASRGEAVAVARERGLLD